MVYRLLVRGSHCGICLSKAHQESMVKCLPAWHSRAGASAIGPQTQLDRAGVATAANLPEAPPHTAAVERGCPLRQGPQWAVDVG